MVEVHMIDLKCLRLMARYAVFAMIIRFYFHKDFKQNSTTSLKLFLFKIY